MKQLGRWDRYSTFHNYWQHNYRTPVDLTRTVLRGCDQSDGQYSRVIQLTRKTRLRTFPHATIKEGET